jgi:acyl-CoA hydrolase
MSFKKEYAEKLISAEAAAKLIKEDDWVDFGWGVGLPHDLDKAVADHIVANDIRGLKFRGGVVLRKPEIFKIENAPEHLCWNSWHMTGIERKSIAEGIGYYAPIRYSELPRYYRDLPDPVDVAMFRVAPMDNEGYFNFGPSASHMADMCSRAKKIVVEVNTNMPVALGGEVGGEKIHISKVDYIVESTNVGMDLLGAGPTNEIDEAVAKLIVEEIPNGACLQLGIGGMPNAVGSLIADSDLKDLGVHTEMYVDAFVDIANAGKINGKC